MMIIDGELLLTIRDNGQGFETDRLGDADGLGMANMRERANLVGGRLDVVSAPGGGTRVCFQVNLTENR